MYTKATYDGVKEKELDKMQDHEDRDEGIEVNIKTESPLYVLLSYCGLQQEFVRQVPQTRSYHQTHLKVNKEYGLGRSCIFLKVTPMRSTKMT